MNAINNVLDLRTDHLPSISSSAMLVELSISSWTGRKKDKNASKQVTDGAGADAAVASVNKALLSDCDQLRNVKTLIGEARNHVHYRLTMPWSDTGTRLLPTELYFEYQQEITDYEAQIMAEVDDLIDNFEHAKAMAQNRMGSLFNEDDYPTAESLREKFKFRVSYFPLPEAGDFRLDINNDAVDGLKQQYESAYTQRIEAAMKDIWERVHTALSNMSSRLGYNDDGKPLVFRDSLIDNAIDLVHLMKKCNVTKDTQMEAMTTKLENLLHGVSADGLRESTYLRDEKKKDLDKLIDTLPSIW
jgi:hypothetical protein